MFAAIAAAALAYVLWEGRGNTFFYDEWGWIEVRRSGLHSILGSYNQHMEVVPLAVYQLLFHTIGVSSYWPFRLLAALAHLACAAAIFAYARRRIGPVALLIAVPVAFFGAGWEFILWGLNFGFTASIALSIAALISLDRGDRRGDAVACGLLTFGLMFSETAVLFSVGVALELALRDRSLRRVWVSAVPVMVYAAWWLAFYTPYLSEHDVGAIPGFTARLAAGAAGGLFGLGVHPGWLVLAAVVVAVAVRAVRAEVLTPRFGGLVLTIVLFWGLVAYGRAELGDPGASRYVYTGSVLVLLLVLEAFRGLRASRSILVVVAILAGVSLIGNIRAFGPGENWLRTGSRTTAAELGALQLARATAPPGMVLDPQWAPQVVAGSYFEAIRALGSTPAVPPRSLLTQPGTIRVAVDRLLMRVGEVALAPVGPAVRHSVVPPVVAAAPGAEVSRDGGCMRLTPTGPAGAFNLIVPASGLELASATPRGTSARPDTVTVRRFASVYATPLGAMPASGAVVVKPVADDDPRPWQMLILGPQAVEACRLRSS